MKIPKLETDGDNREEMVIIALLSIAIIAMISGQGQIAAGAAGALGGYLKGRKKVEIPPPVNANIE